MCGRYSQTADGEKLGERFGCKIAPGKISRRYNIAPMQEAPVVVAEGTRQLKPMQWGLVPSWAKEAAIGNKMINARAETLTEKPSFRKSFERQRCLVPADGFYEWRKLGQRTKVPVRITLRSREPFAFAGLWDTWKKPDSGELQSFTIVTTEPNELMRPIHNRMPVILRREDEEMWLDPDLRDTARLLPALTPYPPGEMDAYDVSALVNSPKNDVPECIAPAGKAKELF